MANSAGANHNTFPGSQKLSVNLARVARIRRAQPITTRDPYRKNTPGPVPKYVLYWQTPESTGRENPATLNG